MTTITGTPVIVPLIRACANQIGLAIEASKDGGKTWLLVQLNAYRVRETPTVRAYSTAIDPARDVAEYFAELDRRGVRYVRARE